MPEADLSRWTGKTRTRDGCLGVEIAGMLHATLAPPGAPQPAAGDEMPWLWHWSAFTPKVPMALLAGDGHPERGGFLPPVNLPRRMWAGGSVKFHQPLHVQARLRQVSTIRAVEEKSDTMTFVSVEHEVYEGDVLAVTETQNIVYLEIPERFTPPKPRPVPEVSVFDVTVPVS